MKFEDIKELIELLNKKDIDKVKIKNKDFQITIEKESKSVSKIDKITTLQPQIENSITAINQSDNIVEKKVISQTSTSNRTTITSPMVGTFYAAPSPDSPPFVNGGR